MAKFGITAIVACVVLMMFSCGGSNPLGIQQSGRHPFCDASPILFY